MDPTKPLKTILAHILPKASLFDGEHVIPLDDRPYFNIVVDSLADWVASRKPSVLIEHERNGESLGHVNAIIEDDRGIFAELVLEGEAAARFEDDAYRFVSPTIAWQHRADDFGDRGPWPAALLEVSFVSVPRHSRQVPVSEISQMAEKETGAVFYNEKEQTEEHVSYFSAYVDDYETYFLTEQNENQNEGELEMDLEKLNEMFAELLERQLAPLLERLDKLEAPEEEPAEEEAAAEEMAEEEAAVEEKAEEKEEEAEEKVEELYEEKDESEESLSELSETDVLNERIKELEKRSVMAEANVEKLNAEIAHRDAVLHVGNDIASRPHLSSMSERLVNIFKTDKNLYSEVLDVVPEGATSVLGERVTVGFAKADVSLGNPYEAASKLAGDEGISYREAFTRLNK
jgi:hypothetical protein